MRDGDGFCRIKSRSDIGCGMRGAAIVAVAIKLNHGLAGQGQVYAAAGALDMQGSRVAHRNFFAER